MCEYTTLVSSEETLRQRRSWLVDFPFNNCKYDYNVEQDSIMRN